MAQTFITKFAGNDEYDENFWTLSFPNTSLLADTGKVVFERDPYLITGKSTGPFSININNGWVLPVNYNQEDGTFTFDTKPYVGDLQFVETFSNAGGKLLEVNLPKVYESARILEGRSTFAGCANIKAIDLMITSELGYTYRMFAGCRNLKKLVLHGQIGTENSRFKPDWISATFNQCVSLTDLEVPSIVVGLSFADCPLSLKSAKNVLNALGLPIYENSRTITFSQTTKDLINADGEALELAESKMGDGWDISL